MPASTASHSLVLEHEGADRFLQFTSLEASSGDPLLGFAFPDAPWSRRYFEPLRAALSEHGIDFAVSETGDEHTPRFIELECKGHAIGRALDVARIACGVMGLGEADRFSGRLEGEFDSQKVIADSTRRISARLRRRD